MKMIYQLVPGDLSIQLELLAPGYYTEEMFAQETGMEEREPVDGGRGEGDSAANETYLLHHRTNPPLPPPARRTRSPLLSAIETQRTSIVRCASIAASPWRRESPTRK
jgi:hypothetical protein